MMEDIQRQLRFEAEALHTVAKTLCMNLQRQSAESGMALTRRCESLEAENSGLKNRIRSLELEEDARFDQVQADGFQMSAMWEDEKRRLHEELLRSREEIEKERSANTKFRIQLASVEDELRSGSYDNRFNARAHDDILKLEQMLAMAEVERDTAIADASTAKRELGIVRDKLRAFENTVFRSM
eukprot:m.260335 g.260335  ORF g.260335 m.260335 type:complete len:184 (+) comp39683_c0_seq1:147-698(+)